MPIMLKDLLIAILLVCLTMVFTTLVQAANVVPTEIQMPGTQPNEAGNFESPDKCDNCHAGYNNLKPENEPATGWRGAAMGNAGRDAIFWATLGVAEQDFDGAGDLCVRCHSTGGWYGGRSTPTDGSGLAAADDNGVDCDTCHSMTNPDNSDPILQGIMNSPFTANCSDDLIANDIDPLGTCSSPTEGYYGSGMLSIWGGGSDKLGPYSDTAARHQFMQSNFHRSVDFCGSCHDVSNPAVGDLAPGNGAQPGNPHSVVSSSGNLGGPIEDKAAFNNPPYAYGIVERTFSEYKASAFPTTLVSDFTDLPADLQVAGGSLETTYQAAMLAGTGGNYEDGTERFFSCQSCHMRPVVGKGCNKNGAPNRKDLPMHDQTGGNYWFANMTQYQDNKGTLRLGGGLTGNQVLAMDLGQQRAVKHLQQAGSLSVSNNILKVTNLTGHKLISGYPEGRRMWLNIKWYDTNNILLREDGAYGPLLDGNGQNVMVNNPAGGQVQVESILNLNDPKTKIYEAHYAVTKDWATTILALHGDNFVLSYDRLTGAVECTVSDFINDSKPECSGDHHDTFHFALNNYVASDNRIPPYGMRFDVAQKRNALPVPANQYGGGTPGSIYNYWDEIDLNTLKPAGAVYASIDLLYQGTSWEYIQFLWKGNNGQNAFLGQEGVNMLDAWINAEVPVAMEFAGDRKMVPPVVITSTTWGTPPSGNVPPVAVNDSYTTAQNTALTVLAPGVLANDSDTDGDTLTAVLVPNGTVGSVTLNPNGSFSYTPPADFSGEDHFTYQAYDGTALSALATVAITVTATGGGNQVGVSSIATGYYQASGKGKSQTTTFVQTSAIPVGENVIIRSTVVDNNGVVSAATVNSSISGPTSVSITSAASDANGIAEASWQTSAPNRKGNGGTPAGTYTITTTNVSGSWNGEVTSTTFTLQ